MTVTAPDFKADPVAWCVWLLRENPHVYRAYRKAADELFEQNPTRRVSSDMILHRIRDAGHKAKGDIPAINNNASALFSRVYRFQRPQYRDRISVRDSFLDHLDPTSKKLLNDAVLDIDRVVQPRLIDTQRRWA